MQITEPSGQTWRVTRRWLPWRLAKHPGKMASDLVIYPAHLAEAVLLALLTPVFVVLRAVRVIGWPIQIWRDEELRDTQSVRGWRASRARMLQIADGLNGGVPPPSARRPSDDGGTP